MAAHQGFSRSIQAFAKAKEVIPGGVNSPVRAFRAVGGDPVFVKRGYGARFEDLDGNEYIDYVLSWGPLIAGHAHPQVVEAVQRTAALGTSFGAPTEAETELAELVTRIMPSIESVRMVNSGTEAVMSALRLARGYTGRSKIVKFEGCYHGHADSLLIKAGSGVATFSLPDSPGVPAEMAMQTLTVPYNDVESLQLAFDRYGEQIAAVIVEPIAGNMGMIPPMDGFLQKVRDITEKAGSLLIFDEVMTGFRAAYGGAQALYGIRPDLTTLGKVIGGGLPVGAYGGRRDIMEKIAPIGPVYQAGTLSGNPLAMAAGLATLNLLGQDQVYEDLAHSGKQIVQAFLEGGRRKGIPVSGAVIGGMFGCFFNEGPVVDYEAAKQSDTRLYGRYFHELLKRGVYMAPSQLEAGFVSIAHGQEEIEKTQSAILEALLSL